MLIRLLVLALVIVTILLIAVALRRPRAIERVEFVGAVGMSALFDDDASTSGFFSGMSRQDVMANANGCTHLGESASQRYLRSVAEPDGTTRERISALVRRASVLAAGLMPAGVPWKIAVLYPGGFGAQFPHTLGDVVCMPLDSFADADRVVRTLVHERVHVFQRMFPEATERLLVEHWGLRRAYMHHSVATEGVFLRSNPDLDGWLWTERRGGHVVAQVYTSSAPADLSASSALRFKALTPSLMGAVESDPHAAPPTYEHPYERMAYELEAYLCQGTRQSSGLEDWWALWQPGRPE